MMCCGARFYFLLPRENENEIIGCAPQIRKSTHVSMRGRGLVSRAVNRTRHASIAVPQKHMWDGRM